MTVHAPNGQLKQAVETSGLTYAALASAVRILAAEHGETLRTNKSTVDHWIKGTHPAGRTGWYLAQVLSRRLGRLLTEEDLGLPTPDGRSDDSIGLSLNDDPIDTLLPIWSAELDRRRFLTSSAYSAAAALLPLGHLSEIAGRAHAARLGRAVGLADVAAVRDMVSMFTSMDERHGGQHGRTALITYLRDDAAPLCRARFATDRVRTQMLSAASRGVHLAGFKAYDAGQQGLAQRYHLQSFALASEGGVPGNAGFVLRTMAMQALKRSRPEACQDLAETGLRWAKGKVDAHTEAEFRVVYAHTLAEGGQAAAALDQMNHAFQLITTPRPDDPPFWALAWGPSAGSVYARAARVFTALGDPANAADLYGQAAAARPRCHLRPRQRPQPCCPGQAPAQAGSHRNRLHDLGTVHGPHDAGPVHPDPQSRHGDATRPEPLPVPRSPRCGPPRRARRRLPHPANFSLTLTGVRGTSPGPEADRSACLTDRWVRGWG